MDIAISHGRCTTRHGQGDAMTDLQGSAAPDIDPDKVEEEEEEQLALGVVQVSVAGALGAVAAGAGVIAVFKTENEVGSADDHWRLLLDRRDQSSLSEVQDR